MCLRPHLHPFITQYLNTFLQFPSFDRHLLPFLSNLTRKDMGTHTNLKLRRELATILADMETS